jgi:hypothetical protein
MALIVTVHLPCMKPPMHEARGFLDLAQIQTQARIPLGAEML